jgi:glyoxylase-like metal-dependent hydrolase (beta-lactamase superfamily II)
MNELEPGLWYWVAPHPEWTEKDGGPQGWPQEVTSYAWDDGVQLLLVDPLALPPDLERLVTEREPAIVLTCPWHERDARALAERLGAAIHVPPPEEGSGDSVTGRRFSAGDRLSIGIEAFPGNEPNDLVLWAPSRQALFVGDTLIDRGNGLELPETWLREGVSAQERRAALRELLDLPVEHVLPTHGPPTDRAALERALR